MCYTCGCKMPYNDMGDPKNITETQFEQASQTDAIEKAGITKAKQNMLELLKMELEKDQLEKPEGQY
jgi:hypothetical protein